MKDCGEARICLGIAITQDRKNRQLKIFQRSYAEKVLQRFSMFDCKPVSTPMECQIDNAMISEEAFPNTTYRQAIGSLMFLMICTRPDLAFSVCRLSQFMEHPTKELWTGVKRVMRYLKCTISMGIVYI